MYPAIYQQVLIPAQEVVKRLGNEVLKLPNLGIAPPKQEIGLHIDPLPHVRKPDRLVAICFYLPKFSFPPHILLQLRNPKQNTGNRQPSNPPIFYYLSQPDAEAELATKGLAYVVSTYGGIWLNRDPYEFFRNVNNRNSFTAYGPILKKDPDKVKMYDKWPDEPPPLQTTEGYSIDLLNEMQRRLTFCSRLTSGVLPARALAEVLSAKTYPVSDDLINHLALPDETFADNPVTIKILPDNSAQRGVSKQFLDSLRSVKKPLAFEVVAEGETIYFQLSFAPEDRELVERQLQLYFEDYVTIERPGFFASKKPLHVLVSLPSQVSNTSKTLRDFAVDPYNQLFSILSGITSADTACAQILFVPLSNGAVNQVALYLENHLPFDSEEAANKRVRDLERKLPSWFTAVRLFSSKPELLTKLHTSFIGQYETPEQTWTVAEESTVPQLDRNFTEWTILSTEELAALVHFPGSDINCDRLETASMKSKLPPALFTTGEVTLGISEVRGETKLVTLPDQVRDKHLYIVGKTGMGKSTLLFNLALQDIQRGAGIAVIDPHGDLVEELLTHIPSERINDAIYFDAADREHPIALNIMNADGDEEIGRLADDLLTTFKRLSKDTGDKMEYVLTMTFYTLLSIPGSTFLDIESMLSDSEFRERVIAKLQSPRLVRFWQQQFHGLRDAVQPILTRMSKFSMSPTISGLLSQSGSALDFYDVIQEKKILLVNLASGKIGEHSSMLLGSLLVSQLQLAVMRRAYLAKGARHPYYLYVDEFQNFTSTAFEKILSEARKYQLCLTLAHQFVSQLDESQRKAIFGNVGTAIMFSLGAEDANALKYQIGNYEPTDLINLPEFEALCRPATSVADTFNFITLPPPAQAQGFADDIIKQTRERYAAASGHPHDALASQTNPVQVATPSSVEYASSSAVDVPIRKTRLRPEKSVAKESPSLGRGGQQHKYLQDLIKRIAESKGYRAIIEQQVLGGAGSVDVSLEKDEVKIACEISVTSTAEQEVKNVQKCLASGYDKVILLAPDQKALTKLRKVVEGQIESESMDNVMFFHPKDFVDFLEKEEAEGSNKEETVRGYKVRVKYTTLTDTDKQARKKAISQVIMQALRRMKKQEE
ncbi:MAG: hypothetical protein AUG51_02865 [Acidobacteria bacterium 13_1_20CM_3_53_8]|nr:MAG: hypothetical protein AUG51_02865 [Acidobacteria bacterium 13_1_20CM_3_53_8]